MGYGRGSTGTGMHSFRPYRFPAFHYTEDQLMAIARLRMQGVSICALEEAPVKEEERHDVPVYTIADCHATNLSDAVCRSAGNLAFGIVSALTDLRIEMIKTDELYKATAMDSKIVPYVCVRKDDGFSLLKLSPELELGDDLGWSV